MVRKGAAMTPQAFALFDTPIGTCGVAWNKNGIAGMQLGPTLAP